MNIKCSQCGAQVPIEKDSDFIRCPYCETALYVDTDRTVMHYQLDSPLTQQDLAPLIQRQLAYLEINDQVTLHSSEFFYFPFWRLDTALGASVVIPAAAPPVEDMLQVKSPAGDLKLFRPELSVEHEVREPELLLDDALVEARKLLDNPSIDFRATALLHLPVHRVQYQCSNGLYTAMVMGATGEVFADLWPPGPQKQKDRVLGTIALLAFMLFLLEAALIPWGLAIIPAYAVTAAGIYFLARNTLRKMGW